MIAPTHLLIGTAGTVALLRCSDFPFDRLDWFAVAIGSLAPDIDGGGAITRPSRMFGLFIPWRLGKLIDGFVWSVGQLVGSVFGHRGFFHWPIIGFGIALAALFCESGWWFIFGYAYLLHILADMLTVSGVPLLAPFYTEPISLNICRTGSATEALICAIILPFVLYFGFPLLPTVTQAAFHSFFSPL